MRFGVVNNETWAFFHEVYAEFQKHHETSLFKFRKSDLPFFRDRVNRELFDRDLKAFLQQNDVVFFEWASDLLVKASHLPKTCGIVTRLHRYEMYHFAEQVNWEAVDRVILVSEAKRLEFVERFPEHASKAIVIPEAVSLEKFTPVDKPFTGELGTLCHLTPRKRVYELILDFYANDLHQDGFRLHIGGGKHPRFGDYYQALHVLVKRLGLKDRILWDGPVSDPVQWHQGIDIFLSNSYSEGLQVSPLEAIAAGGYCLSHYWDGADELLPPEYLFLTGQEMAEKIREYASLTEEARLIRKAYLRKRVTSRSDIEQVKKQILQVVEEVGIRRTTRVGK